MTSRSIPGRRRLSCSGARRGFTLMEALVALVILATAVSSALGVFGSGLRVAASVRAHTNAVRLAEARLSELTLVPADSLPYYARPREGAFAPPFDPFAWRAQITPVRGTEGLLHATVLVQWKDGDYRLATELFRRDLVTGVRWRAR